jgi:hypothetical protein
MKNFALFDSETSKVLDYPRADEEPVQGLDPRYQVLRVVRQERPDYDKSTHFLREIRAVDLAAGEWQWNWEVVELPPPPLDYQGFYFALLSSNVYQGLLAVPATAELARALAVFVSAIQDCMNYRENQDAMQNAIWLLLGQMTLSDDQLTELGELMQQYKLNTIYRLQP